MYAGLAPAVSRGQVKYIRVCSEEKAELRRLPNGEYQSDHEPFEDWYASPTHKVRGPHGWPSYVAKGTFGLAPVEDDGSAHFLAPAGKVLYFQALDGDLNEVQRMRSVVQLQPGEERGCIGCHEDRATAPPAGLPMPRALARPPAELQAPPWGAGAFAYERVVQPVWDAHCVRCHNPSDARTIDLSGARERYFMAIELDENFVESIVTTLSIIGKDKNLQSYLKYCRSHKEAKEKGMKDGGAKNKRDLD